MATGNVESWAGNIAEIGAIYPFVGWETPLYIAGLVFWVWWHIAQLRTEHLEIKHEIEQFGSHKSIRARLEKAAAEKNSALH